jgi:hypothetical protein
VSDEMLRCSCSEVKCFLLIIRTERGGHIVEKAESQYCVHPFFAAIMAAVPAYRVIRDYFAE